MNRGTCIQSMLPKCLSVALAIIASLCLSAAAETIDIVTEDLPPLQIVKNGVISGVTTEIVTTAARDANLDYTLKAYPWSRAYQIALHRKNVCIFSIVRLKEREPHFRWAGTLVNIRSHFYKLASRKDVAVRTLEDARRFNTAVVRDGISHHFLLANGFIENKNFYICNDYLTPFKLLHAGGGISLLINDDATLEYRSRKLGLDPAKLERLFEIPELTTDMQVAFSLLTPIHTVHRFSTALERMKQDGRFESIMQKWRIRMKDW